jgi:hypothetical protein
MRTEMTTEAAIQVQGLEKSYQELEVLRGADFDVAGEQLRPARTE